MAVINVLPPREHVDSPTRGHLTVGFPNLKIRGDGSRADRGQLLYCGNFLRLSLIDYFFFFISCGLRRGSLAGAVHLDLETGAARFANDMAAGGCGEPFYDPFDRHEKYDGKLYEVDRGRRRGLHLYLHRIYLPKKMVRPERRRCFYLVCGTAIVKENGLVASSIGGPSIVVVVGRVIFVTERTCVDPLSLI